MKPWHPQEEADLLDCWYNEPSPDAVFMFMKRYPQRSYVDTSAKLEALLAQRRKPGQ